MSPPTFMRATNPVPVLKQRLYNGRKIQVWEGKVKIADVAGWVENPRIDLAKKLFQEKVGARALAQDEILDIMKGERDFKLKELRDDILKNGLREPLTLSFTGKLLDGNRRFFAIKYALESTPAVDPNRKDLEVVDAFVLAVDVSEEDEDDVLVEENFSPSLKLEWPDYVKAQKVVKLRGLGKDEAFIAHKLNWPKAKVKETIKINSLLDDFEAFATSPQDTKDQGSSGLGMSENEAMATAARSYQYFNEAQKSFYHSLQTDIDFKLTFFRWIAAGKFSSFHEVKIAHKAYLNEEAMTLISKDQPGAAKAAKAALEYNERVVRSAEEAAGRIESFVTFLKQLEAAEISKLTPQTRAALKEALDLIHRMSRAATQ